MAEQSFPQIPSTVWWGVRQLLNRSPRAKLDEATLAASLEVQVVAAKQYISELRRAGILDDDCRGTDLANKWRMDDTYAAAVEQIAEAVYPESLVAIAPPGDFDRQKVTKWFMSQGLGEGAAKNKAATYNLITSRVPNAAPGNSSKNVNGRPSKAQEKVPRVQTH